MGNLGRISVIIPVYGEAYRLGELLNRLLDDPYPDKEVLVAADEPSREVLETLQQMSHRIKYTVSGERRGKVRAVEELIESSSGEILLFLDADVALPGDSHNFLAVVAEEIKKADIIDIKKVIIRDSFLAKLEYFEYLGFNVVNWLFSRYVKRCLAINGAAFAITRDALRSLGGFRRVISEDLDLATRSFLKGMAFRFVDDISVEVKVTSSWRRWYAQRKRWSVGASLWIKEYYRPLLRSLLDHPKILIPSLVFAFPSLTVFLVNLFVLDNPYYKYIAVAVFLLAMKFTSLSLPLSIILTSFPLLGQSIMVMALFSSFSLLNLMFARKLRCRFSLPHFFAYFFFYSPLWLAIMATNLMRVIVMKNRIEVDWKT
jgi:biofilm PGA synthesis N-glycosyltransferase PgaC